MAENSEPRDETVSKAERDSDVTAADLNQENDVVMGEVDEEVISDQTPDDQIADLKQQLDDAEDKYLRVQAEMQNMKTRLAKEQAQAVKFANQKLAGAVLPALDNLERALQVTADDEASRQLKTGVEMVFNTLKQALADNEIEAIGQVGEAFDPNLHQAIQSVPANDDHPADTIAEVLQKGYRLADRVIRPAMVAVYN